MSPVFVAEHWTRIEPRESVNEFRERTTPVISRVFARFFFYSLRTRPASAINPNRPIASREYQLFVVVPIETLKITYERAKLPEKP